jgi:CRISPR-associated protein Csb1
MAMLDYDTLAAAVGGTAVGLRARTPLEPLGGPGDKIFPPTYGVANNAETKYAVEQRRIDGASVQAVVVDSVAAQANGMEQALLDALRDGELSLPLVTVDFRPVEGLAGLDRITSLDASHRVFDAVLRDSLHGDLLFRLSDVGRAITEATNRNAAALYRYNPATLVFGGWDSTGPKGGRGAKYERAITSEIVALGIDVGRKTASRIDAVGIELKAGRLYEARDQSLGEWTLDQAEAAKDDKGKPKLLTGGEGAAGRPSQVNHGNVTPSIDPKAGGVTADRIEATTVISFAALRKLRFPTDTDDAPLPDDRRRAAESAARTALAALGVAAAVLAFDGGFDLRSRCVLVPVDDLEFELLERAGKGQRYTLDRQGALRLVGEATRRAAELGLVWEQDEILLRPTDRLADLIRRSHDPSIARLADDEAEGK